MIMKEIKKQVPIPEKKSGKKAIYPFKDLEIGDSFVYGTYTREKMQRCGSYIRYYKKRYGMNFTQRKTDNNLLRVWRTE